MSVDSFVKILCVTHKALTTETFDFMRRDVIAVLIYRKTCVSISDAVNVFVEPSFIDL